MSKSKTESLSQSKAAHDKITKQIKALSVQVANLSKQIDKVCPCRKGMECGSKKMSKSKAKTKVSAKRK